MTTVPVLNVTRSLIPKPNKTHLCSRHLKTLHGVISPDL